jgi:hypothetical protein
MVDSEEGSHHVRATDGGRQDRGPQPEYRLPITHAGARRLAGGIVQREYEVVGS